MRKRTYMNFTSVLIIGVVALLIFLIGAWAKMWDTREIYKASEYDVEALYENLVADGADVRVHEHTVKTSAGHEDSLTRVECLGTTSWVYVKYNLSDGQSDRYEEYRLSREQ